MKGLNVGVVSKVGWNCFKWGETSIAVFSHHVPLHTIHSTKGFFADRTEPTHGNSSRAECRLKNRWNVEHLYRFSGHKILLFSSSTTITTIFPLFSLHHHHHRHHISIVFAPPPPPPHFNCFRSSSTTTTFQLFSLLLHHHHISIVFYPSPTRFIFFFTIFYKRLPTAIFSSFCSNISCIKQQSRFSSAVS